MGTLPPLRQKRQEYRPRKIAQGTVLRIEEARIATGGDAAHAAAAIVAVDSPNRSMPKLAPPLPPLPDHRLIWRQSLNPL